MAFDLGTTLSGAGVGFSLGGPVGAAIGGGAGLIAGLLGGDEQNSPTYKDYKDPQIQGMISSLLNQKLGQQQAQRAATGIRNQTRETQNQFAENPNFQGNAAVTAAFNNKIARTGEEGIANANIQGAQVDQDAIAKAAQLQQSQNQYSLQRNQFDRGGYELNQQPTYLQNLFGTALNAGVGSALGRAMGTNPTTTTNPNKLGSSTYSDNSDLDLMKWKPSWQVSPATYP